MLRYAALGFALVVAAISYAALMRRAAELDLPFERSFGASAAQTRVYIEPIAVNAAGETMQLRISVNAVGASAHAPAERDFSLLIGHDDAVERIEVHARQPVPVTTIDLDLNDGDIVAYPLDSYRAGLTVHEVAAQGESPPPLKAVVWERVLGFRLRASQTPSAAADEINLAFDIRRGFTATIFALCAYAAMALMGLGALTIGLLVFLGIRKPEATLMGALAGMVFALPTLRNALPGPAPLGVAADIIVFLWAELLAVSAITLLIVTWARSGPRP